MATAAQVNGRQGYQINAKHEGQAPVSTSTRVVASFATPLDVSQHRGLGFWVRGDGQGELLFVELTDGKLVRQFYVPVDFTGERYFEFPLGEACAHRYYSYQPWDSFAAWHLTLKWLDYHRVTRSWN